MSILWAIATVALLTVTYVSAYYTGKAELTVPQMLRQREVAGCFFGAYGCWWMYDFTRVGYSFGYVISKFIVFAALSALIILIHDLGKRRKRAQ